MTQPAVWRQYVCPLSICNNTISIRTREPLTHNPLCTGRRSHRPQKMEMTNEQEHA